MRNIYDAFEPLYKMQESIRKMTAPYDSALAVFEQMHRTASIAMQIASTEWVEQHYPSLSEVQKVLQKFNFPQFDALSESFPQLNSLSEFITQTQGIMEAVTGTEAVKSLIDTRTSMQELASRIQEITFQDANVYFPEQLIPDNYSFDVEPECIEYEEENNQSKSSHIKKLSPQDAFDIICTTISILLAFIGLLQNQMSPTQDQMQTLIEKQSEQNELMQKNNDLIQEQIDATLQATEYLANILTELQVNMEESQVDDQQSPEQPVNEDSGSQPTDSNPSESQLKSSISSDAPDAPDMH